MTPELSFNGFLLGQLFALQIKTTLTKRRTIWVSERSKLFSLMKVSFTRHVCICVKRKDQRRTQTQTLHVYAPLWFPLARRGHFGDQWYSASQRTGLFPNSSFQKSWLINVSYIIKSLTIWDDFLSFAWHKVLLIRMKANYFKMTHPLFHYYCVSESKQEGTLVYWSHDNWDS